MATSVQNTVDGLPESFAEKDQEDVKDFHGFNKHLFLGGESLGVM